MYKARLSLLLAAAAFLTGCSTESADDTTMAASVGNSHINPLGEADMSMKTLRPEAPSELVVTKVRVGQHDGFERAVFELEGEGSPGWFVDYADNPKQQGSGQPINYAGDTALNVNIDGVVEAPAGGVITQVVNGRTYEGRSQFVIGMNQRKPYSVQVLETPTRLVVDIRS